MFCVPDTGLTNDQISNGNWPKVDPNSDPYHGPDANGNYVSYIHLPDTKEGGQQLCHMFNCDPPTLDNGCEWQCHDNGNRSSPILIDVNGLGYPDLLAGKSWRKDRAAKVGEAAFRVFNLDLTGPRLWEWVGPKTGILVYWKAGAGAGDAGADGKNIPRVIDGSALFGTHTFGRTWPNGYEALASLDKNTDGQITGDELADLWVWVDANSNAQVDPGEIRPALFYLKALNARPVSYPGGDAEAPKGAVLQSGAMVPTWDWWSAPAPADATSVQRKIPMVYYAPKVAGTGTGTGTGAGAAPDTAMVYIWGMKGKMLGLLRFVSSGADQYVISLPFGTEPRAGYYPALFSKIRRAPGKLDWRFAGSLGNVTELAFVTGTPALLRGENGRDARGENREAYSWKAVVLSGSTDDWVGAYVRAIAGFADTDFTTSVFSLAGDAGTVRLLAGTDVSKTKFLPLGPF
jgi:hypothetical protein